MGSRFAASDRRRVLVIEDNPDAAECLQEVLEELGGHHVEVAPDGPAGLAAARARRPDVVLCDIGLPGMDGYAVARAMRADPALRGVFLVALTGYALPTDAAQAQGAGFDLHFTKPPPFDALQRVIVAAGARGQPDPDAT